MEDFKPLLAVEADLPKLKFPVLASYKLDGIRCVIHPELGPVTRKLKPIPNVGLRAKLAALPPGFDGELICGIANMPNVMQATTSAVMGRHADFSDVCYFAFDYWLSPEVPFNQRLDQLVQRCLGTPAVPLHHAMIYDMEELRRLEEQAASAGYEGLMLRDPAGCYKFGRSTQREGILLKVKRFADMEGVVVDFEERMHNDNALEKDALGHAKRSTAKAGKAPAGTLGAVVLEIDGWKTGRVPVGTGFTDEQRLHIWQNRADYMGKVVTFKYQPSGSKDAPRFPIFKAWRTD